MLRLLRRCSSTASPRPTSTRSATCRVADGGTRLERQAVRTVGMPADHRGTIDFWRDGIVTRGVLYDIPRLRGTDFVDPGSARARLGARRRRSGAGRRSRRPATRCSSAAATAVLRRHRRASRLRERRPASTRRASSSSTTPRRRCSVWDMQDAPSADQGIPNPSPASRAAARAPHPPPLHGHADPRQRRPRGPRGRRAPSPTLGVPVRGRARS